MIKIRQLRQEDYRGVRLIDELTQSQYLGSGWDELSHKRKEDHLKSRKSEFATNVATGYSYVAYHDTKVIGFILAYETLPFRGTIFIRHIAILPEFQGQGIGLLLYKKIIAKARRNKIKKIVALINPDNPKSIRLHAKVGFVFKYRKEAALEL